MSESAKQSAQLPELFHEIYETFAHGILDDVECLYVVGLIRTATQWAAARFGSRVP
jgi:hypothetical protein